MKTQWREICENLQKKLNPGTYKVWIAPLQAELSEGQLCLAAPNEFVANWVRERLAAVVSEVAENVIGSAVRVVVRAMSAAAPQGGASGRNPGADDSLPRTNASGASQGNLAPTVVQADTEALARQAREARRPLRVQSPAVGHDAVIPTAQAQAWNSTTSYGSRPWQEQLALPIHTPARRDTYTWRYAFNDFVVGPSNDMAFAAAQNLARDTSSVDTLFLSSGPGLGKTHLTQAVGQALCQASNRAKPKVEYLTAEEFASCFVHAMKARDIDRFKGRFRDVDILLLEDVHFLQNKEKMQDEVLATIKALQGRGSRVVLTSSFAPRELSNVDDSLVSRFCAGFLAGIEKPDLNMRRRILQEKAKSQDADLPDDVTEIMADRLTGDVRQLESCLHNLILKARLMGRRISVEMAMDILGQYAQCNPFFDLDTITRKVCEGFGLDPTLLTSRSRKADFVLARNTIFYLARKHTDLPLNAIGEQFNRRHSTVLKGIATIERELTRESSVGRQVASTLALIQRNSQMQ